MTLYRVSAGHCEACDKELSESEMRIKGWNSGVELGLCRKCASFVNTPDLVDDDNAPMPYFDKDDSDDRRDFLVATRGLDRYFDSDKEV